MLKRLKSLDQKRLGRLVLGALGVVIAVGYLLEALTIPRGSESAPGPGVFPLGVGIAGIIISLFVVGEALLTKQVSGDIDLPRGVQLRLVVAFFLVTTAFVLLLPILGQYITSSLYVIVMLKILSPLKWWRVVLYGIAIACSISWIFIELLMVRLPGGIW